MKYILAIDQSTSGTKAMLIGENGELAFRDDIPHQQIIDEKGWIEHDLGEIYANTLQAVKNVVRKANIDTSQIIGIGISNQRETTAVWDKTTGRPVCNAIVWQCARGEEICRRIAKAGYSEKIQKITGLPLSPYFSAAKIAWILENVDTGGKRLCAGTIDSWLVFKLTGNFKTDYSNASRTQLLDLHSLQWSGEVCRFFGIDPSILPTICDSNSCFGYTDFEGFFDTPVPIHAVMGDSHGSLFGHGCHSPGMMKATYGTGSSVVMNTGNTPMFSDKGVVTSIAWGMDGKIDYILEGNINYSGAVMKWIVEELGLIESPKLASEYAAKANPEDSTYLVPAFSGLGAPHWNSGAKAILYGMTRTTGKAEIIKAAEECVAYQITDIIEAIAESAAGIEIHSLRADGGGAGVKFLMQFQSDIAKLPVYVPAQEELSGIGVAYAAGIALGLYDRERIFQMERTEFHPSMDAETRRRKLYGWRDAVSRC